VVLAEGHKHTMAVDQSALLDVLDALKAAEVDDKIRQAAETIYQALIEAELSSVIGAFPHQRTETRTAQRNGYRLRTLTATAGDLELRIPKLRAGVVLPVAAGTAAAGGSVAVRRDHGGLPARHLHPQGR
jgi:putative transposase